MALDPELLGKVFENLLGAYNPETEEVVRKSTGSFYTPREPQLKNNEETLGRDCGHAGRVTLPVKKVKASKFEEEF